MERKRRSRGACIFCDLTYTRVGMQRHLAACPQRQTRLAQVDQQTGSVCLLFHLAVHAVSWPDYWLQLEARGDAELADLDFYLRAIWLECCEHLSEFSIGGMCFTSTSDYASGWKRDAEKGMNVQLQSVLSPGDTIRYRYDFGSTTELAIAVVDGRRGKPLSKNPIVLMARNAPLPAECMACGAPATFFCSECRIEENLSGLVCDIHAREHYHNDYGSPDPLVSSPRVGICGYTGPAEPPY
ncbi:MAG: hypothetical protein HYV63_07975 [Candidatus Schekmanbacteria bacterium]|nr:hypothetical protein [Candidatus Schekmanbacteria bacterium]